MGTGGDGDRGLSVPYHVDKATSRDPVRVMIPNLNMAASTAKEFSC